MSEETINTNVRGLPKWVRDELAKDAKENVRTVNGQIIYVLTEWAKARQ